MADQNIKTPQSAEPNSVLSTPRFKAVMAIPVTVAFGLACKVYSGSGANFINNFGPASIAYVILIMLILFLILPERDLVIPIALTAFLVTCVIEFLQLWHPNWLTALRKTLLGRLMLGTTFSVLDFPAYLVGAIIGSLLLKRICRDSGAATQPDKPNVA